MYVFVMSVDGLNDEGIIHLYRLDINYYESEDWVQYGLLSCFMQSG